MLEVKKVVKVEMDTTERANEVDQKLLNGETAVGRANDAEVGR